MLDTAAQSHAQAFIDNASVLGAKGEKLRALAAACVDLSAQATAPTPAVITWKKLTTPAWPSTVCVVRGSAIRNGELYISTGGSQNIDAQCWKRVGDGFVKHSHFDKKRMNCLLVDPANNDMYMGLGSQNVPGSAFVCKYDAAGNYTQIGSSFAGQDIIYSMCWHDGKVHAGTMSEDIAGSARVAKLENGAWSNVFAPGLDGLPSSYTYAGAYINFEFNGMLHAGMFSRTAGHAHVWRRTANGWVNLGCPFPTANYALASIEHDGNLVICFSVDGAYGPVRAYNETTQQWDQVGSNVPSEWAGAKIFNHMVHDMQGRLLVGVGGAAGELSVWRLENNFWSKLAGGGINGSWTAPIGSGGAAEWIYRLVLQPDGRVIACIASESANGATTIWEMTEA